MLSLGDNEIGRGRRRVREREHRIHKVSCISCNLARAFSIARSSMIIKMKLLMENRSSSQACSLLLIYTQTDSSPSSLILVPGEGQHKDA